MSNFSSVLRSSLIDDEEKGIRKTEISTLQVNLGNLCNQNCRHCHIEASPQGGKIASRKVIDDILEFLGNNRGLVLDITGGAPELNPHLDYLVRSARSLVKEIIVRSNLTVLFEPGREYLPEFFKEQGVHLICSLPCYTKKNVEMQRGKNVFEKSIRALRLLNDLGFTRGSELSLDLVYNPGGADLPPQQKELEGDYRQILGKDYGIEFDNLITITNVPIRRFRKYLEREGEYNSYLELLRKNFNPSVLENLMCRTYMSVGHDGKLYDCDFNQSLGLPLKDREGNHLTIDKVNIRDLENQEVILDDHCFACTAGYGSSCQGALAGEGRGKAKSNVPFDNAKKTKDLVKTYYGEILSDKKELKTSVCCSPDTPRGNERDILQEVAPEILSKFYGCGSPIPPLLQDCIVLDLGCGTGRDTYLVSKLVGANGLVIGVDMTDEQLRVARKYRDFQMRKFGYTRPNVEFKKGDIEDLESLGIKDNSLDVVISNCVVNLSPDKKAVFSEIFRVLKPGGELYFADIFADRRIPEHLRSDPVLYGECLGGALYIEDFRRILREVGCLDYRLVSQKKIALESREIEAKAGMIDFYSITVRAFKLKGLEDICEDYGQTATYEGTIPGHAHKFIFDEDHTFPAGKPVLVCGNTATMISDTRYGKHFRIRGERVVHYGPFPCASNPVKKGKDEEDSSQKGTCCP